MAIEIVVGAISLILGFSSLCAIVAKGAYKDLFWTLMTGIAIGAGLAMLKMNGFFN